MKKYLIIILTLSTVTACVNKESQADAWGNFEADEVIISSETSGRIITMDIDEGSVVESGAVLAVTDTIMLRLQRDELSAAMSGALSRLTVINSQNRIVSQQMDNLQVNVERTVRMLAEGAATQKQLDDLTGQIEVLKRQQEANNSQKATVQAEISSVEAKRAILDEQIRRSTVRAPFTGTIMEKYALCHELTAPGKPLIKISDLRMMKLKVWVSGAQLADVHTGSKCIARIDDGEKGYREFQGTIAHISDKAEFTPKIIQTKEERVTLVYAVTIDVPNDGSIKAGMPGEAIFNR